MMLATVSMVASVGLIAAFACFVLDLPLGAGILLGAILSPTDPVLATDVQIRHPGDRDQLRFTLTCEAGMNDGSAFPFVMLGLGLLGLHDLGDSGMRWVLVDVLWATVGAIAIGVAAGMASGPTGDACCAAWPQHQTLLNDFLGLGLIGVVYGLSVMVDAWGFLAVFFAAVALRQTEPSNWRRPAKPGSSARAGTSSRPPSPCPLRRSRPSASIAGLQGASGTALGNGAGHPDRAARCFSTPGAGRAVGWRCSCFWWCAR